MRRTLFWLLILLASSSAAAKTLVNKDTSGVLLARQGETEIVGARTREFKRWLTAQPSQFRVAGSVGPIHYRLDPFSDSEQYKEIDLDVQLTPGQDWDAACETNGFQVRFWQSRVVGSNTIRMIAQFRRAGHWIAMAPMALAWMNSAGQTQIIATPVGGITPIRDNALYRVTWQNAFGSGIDFCYNLRPDEFFKTVVVNQKSALPAPTISTTGLKLVLVMAVAWDPGVTAANGFASSISATNDLGGNLADLVSPDESQTAPAPFAFLDSLARQAFWATSPRAWDSYADPITGAPHAVPVDWELRRKGGNVFALFSVSATALNNAATVYPVYLDTTMAEQQITTASDESNSYSLAYPGTNNGGWGNICQQLGINYYTRLLGCRFASCPIPKGAGISTATISLCDYYGDTGAYDFNIWGEAADNSATFQAPPGTRHPYSVYQNPTAHSPVEWSGSDTWASYGWYTSPNIAAIVGDINSRAGWASGNAMTFVVGLHSASSAGFRTICDYGYMVSNGPKFDCTYNTSSIKTINGVAKASVKTVNGLAIGSVKTWDGLP